MLYSNRCVVAAGLSTTPCCATLQESWGNAWRDATLAVFRELCFEACAATQVSEQSGVFLHNPDTLSHPQYRCCLGSEMLCFAASLFWATGFFCEVVK